MGQEAEAAFEGHAPAVTTGKIFNATNELRWHIRKEGDRAMSFLQQKFVAWDKSEEEWRDVPVHNDVVMLRA